MPAKFIIAERLRELRRASGLTQEEFAEHAGIGYKFYQHIEAGRKKLLRIDTLERLCAAYKIPLWKFFHPVPPHVSVIAHIGTMRRIKRIKKSHTKRKTTRPQTPRREARTHRQSPKNG